MINKESLRVNGHNLTEIRNESNQGMTAQQQTDLEVALFAYHARLFPQKSENEKLSRLMAQRAADMSRQLGMNCEQLSSSEIIQIIALALLQAVRIAQLENKNYVKLQGDAILFNRVADGLRDNQ